MLLFNKPFFHTFIRTDVGNIVSEFFQSRQQGDVWSDVSGCTTAGKNDFFHMIILTINQLSFFILLF